MSVEQIILYAVLTPLVGAGLIAVIGDRPNIREAATLVSGVVLFGLVANLYPLIANEQTPQVSLFEMLPGLPLSFQIEPLGMIFAGIASFLWIVTSIYSIGYMRGHHEKNQTRFYFFFAIAISAAIGIAFAGNMLTLFVFYEVLTISTFPLVTHSGTDDAKRGGRVYLGILMGTSIVFLLTAVIWTWSLTGTLDFTAGGILAGKVDGPPAAILFALYMFGIGKAALMPFHRWLPAAMVAPTPVSALLHAVAVVKAGAFSIVKVIVYIFGVETLTREFSSGWLLYVSGFTIIAASIVALRSDNLKRRLAYSTVSQLSYVVLAAAILSPISVMAAAFHIAAHAFGKITLFFAAGSIMVASNKTLVSQLDGIGRRMPWTMGAFFIGALSMIGLPPTAGFVTKWYLLTGAFDAGQMVAVGVIVLSTLLNAGYFLPIVYAAFFRKDPTAAALVADETAIDKHHPPLLIHGEAPVFMVIALSITAAGTVALFLFPDWPLGLAQQLVGGTP